MSHVLSTDYLNLVQKCVEKVLALETGATPQQYFMKHFSNQYKLADAKVPKKEEIESDDEENDSEMQQEEEEEIKEVKEDSVASSVEFRHWRILSKANSCILEILNDIVQLASVDEEEEYEEIEGDEEGDQAVEESKES